MLRVFTGLPVQSLTVEELWSFLFFSSPLFFQQTNRQRWKKTEQSRELCLTQLKQQSMFSQSQARTDWLLGSSFCMVKGQINRLSTLKTHSHTHTQKIRLCRNKRSMKRSLSTEPQKAVQEKSLTLSRQGGERLAFLCVGYRARFTGYQVNRLSKYRARFTGY